MAATIGQKHKNGFKIVEIWDNHSESLKNNLYNDFKGPEHLLGGMNLENEIDTCQTTVCSRRKKAIHKVSSIVNSHTQGGGRRGPVPADMPGGGVPKPGRI